MSEVKPELKQCFRCHSNCTLEHYEKNRKGEWFKLCNNCRNRNKKDNKTYYNNHKEELLEQHRIYKEEHTEERKQQAKEYREQNKDKLKQKHKTYYENHKEAILSKHSEREKAKRVARNEQLFQERPELREIFRINKEKRELFMKYKNAYLAECEAYKQSESAKS